MKKHSLQLDSARLNDQNAPQCDAQLVFGINSLSVMATDSAKNLCALETWEYAELEQNPELWKHQVRQIFQNNPILNLPFRTKAAVLFHPNVTLVPRRMFQADAMERYFKLLLQPGDYQFDFEEMPEFGACMLFATPEEQYRLFQQFFPETQLRHLATSLLHYFRKMAGLEKHIIFVHLRHHTAQIAVFERQNLLLYNSYSFDTATDLLYFVLLVFDQFRFSPQEVPLAVSGNILRDSELFRMLYRFIREIRFAVPPVQYKAPE
ncbi:MAG: DUF3822 family protein, partial [Saprospiraceae bacterium]|nr:DUF3822 family protein [Saprospiraceae bacterium]